MSANEVDILLVDDSQDDLDLTLHALRAENLANHVFIARSGWDAGPEAGLRRCADPDHPGCSDDFVAGRAGHG
jgi:hypothetical protein